MSSSATNFLFSLYSDLLTAPQAGPFRAASSSAVPGVAPGDVVVLDSIAESGAKLVALTAAGVNQIKMQQPGLELVPVRYYTPALAPRPSILQSVTVFAQDASGAEIQVLITDAPTKAAVPDATVTAFTNFAARAGACGVTDASGAVQLSLGGSHPQIERLYIYPKQGYWAALQQNVTFFSGASFSLTPIDMGFQDGLRFCYPLPSLDGGQGVTVGVVDTGIAQHPDLTIAGGFNAVTGEDPAELSCFRTGTKQHKQLHDCKSNQPSCFRRMRSAESQPGRRTA